MTDGQTAELTPEDNLLHGTITDELTHVEGSNKYYKLAYDNATKSVLGFYWGATDGAAFLNKAGKAYLALPIVQNAQQLRSFNIIDMDGQDGSLTGVDTVTNNENSVLQVYDLNGCRLNVKSVNELKQGVYIVNGKKIVK